MPGSQKLNNKAFEQNLWTDLALSPLISGYASWQQTDFRVRFLLSHNKILHVLNTYTSSIDCSRLLNLPLPCWKLFLRAFPAFMMADIRPLGTGQYDERSLSQLPLGYFCHFECARLCPKTKIENWFQFSIFNFLVLIFLILDSSKTEKLSRVTDCNIVGKSKLLLAFIFLFIVD